METTTIIPIRWNNLVELTRTISGPEPETGGLWSLDVRMYSGICKKKKKRFCFTKSVNGSQPLFYSVFYGSLLNRQGQIFSFISATGLLFAKIAKQNCSKETRWRSVFTDRDKNLVEK